MNADLLIFDWVLWPYLLKNLTGDYESFNYTNLIESVFILKILWNDYTLIFIYHYMKGGV